MGAIKELINFFITNENEKMYYSMNSNVSPESNMFCKKPFTVT